MQPHLPSRRLGKSPLQVSAIGLGCMGMSEFYGDADENASIDLIHKALDMGVDFFDTADMYSAGLSEEITGRLLTELAPRDEIVIATKLFHPVELAFKGGHIGIYVSGRSQREVPPAIHQWLKARS